MDLRQHYKRHWSIGTSSGICTRPRWSSGSASSDGQVLTVEWVNATAAPTPAPKKHDSDGATRLAVGLYISLAAAAALPFLG